MKTFFLLENGLPCCEVKPRFHKIWKWEGLHRATNHNGEPLQKWGRDSESLMADSHEELMKKYKEKYEIKEL